MFMKENAQFEQLHSSIRLRFESKTFLLLQAPARYK